MKETAYVAISGPSQGRKRPRRASAATSLPHRNNMPVHRIKSKSFFEKIKNSLRKPLPHRQRGHKEGKIPEFGRKNINRMDKSSMRARVAQNERDRLCCHKRSKSREETPKEGIGGNIIAAPQ